MTHCELLAKGQVKAGDKGRFKCTEEIEKSLKKMQELTLTFNHIVRYKTESYVNGTRIVDINKSSRLGKVPDGNSCTCS